MNRRKIFGVIPLSMLGLVATAKIETGHHGNPWVERTCQNRFMADGKLLLEHMIRGNGIVQGKPESYWVEEGSREALYSDWRVKSTAVKELADWNAATECGQKFKYVRGAHVFCPKCGGFSAYEGNEKGIPV